MSEYDVATFYPHLREVLDDRFAALPDDQLEAAFEAAFGEGITPAEYEEFFGGLAKAFGGAVKDVGRFAQQAAPVLASGAQGALQGAAAGSVAGPWGALGGALLGGVGSALQSHGRGAARDVGSAISGVVNTAGMLTGRGGAAQAGAGMLGSLLGQRGGPALSALRGVLGRPEMAQALSALFAGRNPAIPVGAGRTPVPANAFAGLLSALAREAEAEAESVFGDADTLTVPTYLTDSTGQLVVDPNNAEHRAGRLLQLLAGAEAEEHATDAELDGREAAFDESEWDELDGAGDEDVWSDVDEAELYVSVEG